MEAKRVATNLLLMGGPSAVAAAQAPNVLALAVGAAAGARGPITGAGLMSLRTRQESRAQAQDSLKQVEEYPELDRGFMRQVADRVAGGVDPEVAAAAALASGRALAAATAAKNPAALQLKPIERAALSRFNEVGLAEAVGMLKRAAQSGWRPEALALAVDNLRCVPADAQARAS